MASLISLLFAFLSLSLSLSLFFLFFHSLSSFRSKSDLIETIPPCPGGSNCPPVSAGLRALFIPSCITHYIRCTKVGVLGSLWVRLFSPCLPGQLLLSFFASFHIPFSLISPSNLQSCLICGLDRIKLIDLCSSRVFSFCQPSRQRQLGQSTHTTII